MSKGEPASREGGAAAATVPAGYEAEAAGGDRRKAARGSGGFKAAEVSERVSGGGRGYRLTARVKPAGSTGLKPRPQGVFLRKIRPAYGLDTVLFRRKYTPYRQKNARGMGQGRTWSQNTSPGRKEERMFIGIDYREGGSRIINDAHIIDVRVDDEGALAIMTAGGAHTIRLAGLEAQQFLAALPVYRPALEPDEDGAEPQTLHELRRAIEAHDRQGRGMLDRLGAHDRRGEELRERLQAAEEAE